jgi:hypothetical protein
LKKRFKILTLGPNPKASEENSGNSMIQTHSKKRVLIKNGKMNMKKVLGFVIGVVKNKIELI